MSQVHRFFHFRVTLFGERIFEIYTVNDNFAGSLDDFKRLERVWLIKWNKICLGLKFMPEKIGFIEYFDDSGLEEFCISDQPNLILVGAF